MCSLFGCEASELRSWNQEEPIQVEANEASSAKSKTSAAFVSLPKKCLADVSDSGKLLIMIPSGNLT